MIKPLITEKALANIKNGKYTFIVPRNLTKSQIKVIVNKTFDVHVTEIKTINKKGGVKKTLSGKKQTIKSIKTATVKLRDKETIAAFVEEKEGKKGKTKK